MKIDMILSNADIVTMDDRRPHATQIGIHHGRIIGLDEEIAGLTARQNIDVGGATIIPGIIDAHCHTAWFGRTLVEVDLSTVTSIDETLELLKAQASNGSDNEWILAAGYDPHRLGGAYPDISDLDNIASGRPLVIRQSSGHAVIANTEAFTRADILEAQDPEGGHIVRNADGSPTGRLEETAQELVLRLLKPYKRAEIVEAIDLATQVYASQGITSFTEAGIGGGWIGHSPTELRSYQDAADKGQLHARAQLMPTIDSLELLPAAAGEHSGRGLDLGIRTGFGNEMVRLGPTKVFTDGALTGRTAAMTEHYCGEPHNHGMLQADESEIRQRILAAAEAGWTIAAHAIGDHAIDIAISVITEATKRYGTPPTPHRIEHASYLRDDHLPKLRAASIAVTPQAMFVRRFGDAFLKSMGEARSKNIYRARTLLDHGVLVAGSSDRPCIDGNPFEALRTLVERRTLQGTSFSPHERVTPLEALAMYTRDAAEATGAKEAGILSPGKLADLVILDGSPLVDDPESVSKLKPLCTLVGGTPTYGSL